MKGTYDITRRKGVMIMTCVKYVLGNVYRAFIRDLIYIGIQQTHCVEHVIGV